MSVLYTNNFNAMQRRSMYINSKEKVQENVIVHAKTQVYSKLYDSLHKNKMADFSQCRNTP